MKNEKIKEYKRPFIVFIDRDLILNEFGYDLRKDGRLKVDDGGIIETTIDRFLIGVCRSVHTWLIAHCPSFNIRKMYDTNIKYIGDSDYEYIYELIREAQMLQALYIYENGNFNSMAVKDITKNIQPYSIDMVELLTAEGLTYSGI